jgi:signal transduction histidine kinase
MAANRDKIDVAIEPAGDGWQVSIRDNGIGIPPENMQKIFDPFFTSKDVGKGMGLGLSITHQILQAHRAISKSIAAREFTRFRIVFPKPSYDEEPDPGSESVLDQPLDSISQPPSKQFSNPHRHRPP